MCVVAFAATVGVYLTKEQRLWSAVPIFLTVASPVFLNGMILGQTTAFGLGVMMLLACNLVNTETATLRSDLFAAISLTALSIKAPYFVIGVGLLGLFHRWRAILLGGFLITVLLVVASGWAQSGWLADYVAVMRRYSLRDFTGGGFVWADYGGGTPTVTNMLRDLVPGEVLWSLTSGAAVFAAAVLAFLCVRFEWRVRGRTLLLGCTTMMGTYLLFSPYLGGYEDLLVLLPLAVLYLVGEKTAGSLRLIAALVVAVLSLWSELLPLNVGVLLKTLTLVLILLAFTPADGGARLYGNQRTSSP